jgi:hypothetical protein
MPLDHNNKSSTPEGLGCTLSHSSAISYSRARGSTCFGHCPYLSLRDITVHIDANDPHDSWYNHSGDNLHFQHISKSLVDLISEQTVGLGEIMFWRGFWYPGRLIGRSHW